MNLIGVTYIEEALFEEASGTMRNHTVTLHLAEAKTSVAATTLSRLASQDLGRASPTRVNLVLDHVLESLIVSGTEEDHHLHLLASEAIVHNLVSTHLIAEGM